MRRFERSCEVPVGAGQLFRWHARPGAFARLLPPWERVRLVSEPAALVPGALQDMRVRTGPRCTGWGTRWLARIEAVEPPREARDGWFRDRQLEGPFAAWVHTHSMRVEPEPGRSRLVDAIEYTLPLERFAGRLGARLVERKLERMFDHRHVTTQNDLARHAVYEDRPRLDVLVSGASGLVGGALAAFLTTGGHRVRRLVRRAPAGPDEFRWDPLGGGVDPRAAEGCDAVVHLAGENIAGGRWTPTRKDKIRRSRVDGTRQVADCVRAARRRPRVFVSASAIGFYGDRGDELLTEASAPGEGFLADVCREWERAANNLTGSAEAPIRTVKARFGVILSPAGGALAKMLLPFKLGVGGKLGSGDQWMSWIALDDVVYALHHLLQEELAGPVNTVAPNPVTNADYTKALGRVLGRPTVLPLPSFAARAAFGELADELLLGSQRVAPERLVASGFEFAFPELEGALRHVLGRAR